jgi:ComF family protein
MIATIREYSTDLYRLFFPQICGGCDTPLSKGEQHLCVHCRLELPFTKFETLKDNLVEKIFHGRIEIEFATSLLFFSKSEKVQTILHNIKYNEQKELAVFMGRILGRKLQNNPWLKDVTTVIPVPLHPKKLHLRGYNQSELFAEGVSEILQLDLQTKNLVRTVNTATQTSRTRTERWENVENVFSVTNRNALSGNHVLLVDDVLTTGATLESAAQTLKDACNCRVSIATLAFVL